MFPQPNGKRWWCLGKKWRPVSQPGLLKCPDEGGPGPMPCSCPALWSGCCGSWELTLSPALQPQQPWPEGRARPVVSGEATAFVALLHLPICIWLWSLCSPPEISSSLPHHSLSIGIPQKLLCECIHLPVVPAGRRSSLCLGLGTLWKSLEPVPHSFHTIIEALNLDKTSTKPRTASFFPCFQELRFPFIWDFSNKQKTHIHPPLQFAGVFFQAFSAQCQQLHREAPAGSRSRLWAMGFSSDTRWKLISGGSRLSLLCLRPLA